MKHKMNFLTSILPLSVAAMAIGLAQGTMGTTKNIKPTVHKQISENILYSEDFSSEVIDSSWNGNFAIDGGKAVFTAANTWAPIPVPSDKWVASNNYDLSFDIKYDSTAELYFHMVHLDGESADRNIYLAFIDGGTYMRLANYGECDIYDNSGDDQGCQDQGSIGFRNALHSEEGTRMRFLILDDVIEVWGNGRRMISVPMSAFGNNRYSYRRNIVKGILDGFAFDCRGAAGSLVIDNILLKEAQYGATDYVMDTPFTGGTTVLPLTYENLYSHNFRASATFEIHRSLVTNPDIHSYPRMQFVMVHPMAGHPEDPSNYLVAQTYLDREFATPWMGAMKEDWNYGGVGLDYLACNYENSLYTLTVEVFGDNIRFIGTSNGADGANYRELKTSFTELGATRSALLSIRLQNEYTNVLHFEYHGYGEETGVVDVSANKESVTIGAPVTYNAYLFGEAKEQEGYVWYVDDVATTETGLTFVKAFDDAGTHTVKYANANYASNEVTTTVSSRILTVSTSADSAYPGESVVFTASKEGEFSETTEWYVNNVKQEQTGDTFTLVVGEETTYEVYAMCGIKSNVVSVGVLAPTMSISSVKGSYLNSESAVVTASTRGLADDVTYSWLINGVVVPELVGKEVTIDLSSYRGGEEVTVKAVASTGLESNELILSIVYDVKAALVANEYYKTVYSLDVTSESEAFGAYAVATDDAGAYYQPTTNNTDNYAAFGAFNVSSFQWSLEYDFLIPETMNGNDEFYIYPQMAGMDTKNPSDQVELAVAVNANKVRTYIKFHNRGLNLEETEYGTGADLSYGAGITKKGDWNHVTIAIDQTYIAFYINNTMTFFANVPNTTVPSTGCMSMWFSGNPYNTQTGFKNFKIGAIVEPAPDVTGVSISTSKVSGKVGESFSLTANVTPYNAEPKSIEWYVNEEKVSCDQLTYVFTPEKAGEYSIVCKIDGVSSAAKVITVTDDSAKPDEKPKKKGCKGSVIATSAVISGLAIAGASLVGLKKKED